MQYKYIIIIIALIISGCKNRNVFDHAFEMGLSQGTIHDKKLEEASGLVASINNPGKLWTHNDSGNGAQIFLLDDKANVVATVDLQGVDNRDWEDITAGPGPGGKDYIYVGEIGDNNGKYDYKYIYRFEEPVVGDKQEITIRKNIDTITFQLPDGPRDSEALMIDPLSKDLYIFSKREEQVSLYRLGFPQSAKDTLQAEFLLKLPYTNVVASDISADGTEILVKNYDSIYYWKRKRGESIKEALERKPLKLPYNREPQGEAIAFDREGKGYYTLSEEAFGRKAHLLFYRRKAHSKH